MTALISYRVKTDQFHQALKMFLQPLSKAEAQVSCRPPGMSSAPCCLAQILFTPEHHQDAQGINTQALNKSSPAVWRINFTWQVSVETTMILRCQGIECFIVSRGAVYAEWNEITGFISLGFVQKGEEKAFSSGFCRSQDSSLDFDRKRKYYSCHCWISADELFFYHL